MTGLKNSYQGQIHLGIRKRKYLYLSKNENKIILQIVFCLTLVLIWNVLIFEDVSCFEIQTHHRLLFFAAFLLCLRGHLSWHLVEHWTHRTMQPSASRVCQHWICFDAGVKHTLAGMIDNRLWLICSDNSFSKSASLTAKQNKKQGNQRLENGTCQPSDCKWSTRESHNH